MPVGNGHAAAGLSTVLIAGVGAATGATDTTGAGFLATAGFLGAGFEAVAFLGAAFLGAAFFTAAF